LLKEQQNISYQYVGVENFNLILEVSVFLLIWWSLGWQEMKNERESHQKNIEDKASAWMTAF